MLDDRNLLPLQTSVEYPNTLYPLLHVICTAVELLLARMTFPFSTVVGNEQFTAAKAPIKGKEQIRLHATYIFLVATTDSVNSSKNNSTSILIYASIFILHSMACNV